ncbi:MAG: DNA polymerase IV [Bacillota bacterium]
MEGGPSILHVDMDAFYASVEQLDNPALRGKPVLVGHDGPRGVVSAASYESRRFGCRSAQPIGVAKRLCPQAIIVPPRMHRYEEVSSRVFAIFEAHTPLIEPLSIDEAFLDVTGSRRLLGSPEQIARNIKARIHAETGLTASVGVAPNKFLAKLASDLSKPDGLLVINPDDIDRVLPPLPVTRIWGIGPKTAARLESLGIRTIGQLRRLPPDWFTRHFGADGEHFQRLAFGLDDRIVIPDREAKSISQEQTFETDVPDPQLIRDVLLAEVEQVARRLRKHALRARAVGLKIRFGQFQTITRSCTLPTPTDATQLLWQSALSLFDHWAAESFQPVRLIGMAAKQLIHGQTQLELFADPQSDRQRKLDRALDAINTRFGQTTIRRGSTKAD